MASVQNEQGTSIAQKLKKSGVDIIINPFFIGGLKMVSETIRPQVVDFLDHMLRDRTSNIRFGELKITKNHRFFNKTIADIKRMLDEDVLLVSLKHKDKYIIKPDNDITLQEDDILIFLGETKKIFQV